MPSNVCLQLAVVYQLRDDEMRAEQKCRNVHTMLITLS